MKIKVLPKELASRIAAGEVIECPASVVKELVENSIDAGSDRIDITLVQGGKTRIVVEDNGSGIEKEDMPVAIMRHATSKIGTSEDLERIHTLGFRGEALASITAVGRLDIRSRTIDSRSGALIQTEGGKIISSAEVNCSHGTRIQVDDLFYNLPARRKFLKSSLSEFRRISQVVRALSLCHPEIDFTLKNDGRSNLSTLGAKSRKDVLELLWGKEPEIVSTLFDDGPISVECWFQKQPGKKKVKLLSFANGRIIQNAMLKASLHSSLGEVAANVALFLTMPPDQVDVNIHPAKTEVRFRYSKEIFETVRTATMELVSVDPVNLLPGKPDSGTPVFHSDAHTRPNSLSSFYHGYINSPGTATKGKDSFFSRVAERDEIPFDSGRLSLEMEEPSEAEDVNFLGQLDMGYLIFETGRSLFLMDPHAAHERVTFERIRRRSMDERTICKLAVPVEIPPNYQDEVRAYKKDLECKGFKFAEEGEILYLDSIPQGLADLEGNPFDYLYSLIEIWNGGGSPVLDGAVCLKWATMACKASVKLTSKLTPGEALRLWKDLMACDNPYACPHGRPTLLEMSESSLTGYFGR